MLYSAAKTWQGLPREEMENVASHVVNLGFKSPVAPPRQRRKKAESNRKQGRIKHINEAKGFGFISVYGADDVFFHITAANGARLMRGDRVTFEVGEDKRGRLCAKEVRLA